ncbi:hypothetical protein [Eupransor demetentiae]|uniref:Uncharacterized protein n=1 Tax=Eupransor demetentiae TaxID=3109584 RepID=A0ABP0ERZ5_9LACO|nr:hypothetical protein R54876_GBNLAHCA_00498 [Lactobacillaceae bacterium LMG 33000]
MTFNRTFHMIMALVWIFDIYLVATMQMMPAMYVMAVGMLIQAIYAVIFDGKGC